MLLSSHTLIVPENSKMKITVVITIMIALCLASGICLAELFTGRKGVAGGDGFFSVNHYYNLLYFTNKK